MADLTTLKALRARVAEATGPDRDLDADICVALQYVPHAPNAVQIRAITFSGIAKPHLVYESVTELGEWSARAPALTASVDAALAFAEKILPGESVLHIGFDPILTSEPFSAEVWIGESVGMARTSAKCVVSGFARAILSATLDALIAQTEEAR